MNNVVRTTGIPIPSLHNWRHGDPLRAADLDPPNRAIEAMLGAQSVAQEVLYPPLVEGAGNVELFQVMNERDRGDGPGIMQRDYFYAKQLSTGETRIKVAKPHKLQTSPWNGRTVYLTAFRTYVTYSNYTPTTGVRRRATRRDEPFVVEWEFISPEYMTERDPDLTDTSEDIIKAAMIGEDATGIEGVDWEDMNDSGRVWSVLPAAFQA